MTTLLLPTSMSCGLKTRHLTCPPPVYYEGSLAFNEEKI